MGWFAGGLVGCHGKAPGKAPGTVMVACSVMGPSVIQLCPRKLLELAILYYWPFTLPGMSSDPKDQNRKEKVCARSTASPVSKCKLNNWDA